MPSPIFHLSTDEIREIQNRALRKTVELCAAGHPFYRALFQRLGVTPDEVGSVEELVKLPLTKKGDLMGSPESFRLNLPELPVQERVVWDQVYTTGTTGNPTPIYSTTHDFFAIIEAWTRLFRLAGVREDDIIGNLFPLTAYPSGSFLRAAIASAGVGALIVNCLPGATYPEFPVQRSMDDAIRLTEKKRATVLFAVPSFLRRLLMRAEELGVDFSNVRLCCFTGEPVPDGLREDVRARLIRLGATNPTINIRLGHTESQAALIECREGSSLHNVAPDLLHYEIVDPETHRPMPEGQPGLLLLTHLNRRGTVLLRYAVGDITSYSSDPCPDCGRSGGRVLQQPYRADHLTKVKGMLVNPDVIRNLLSARQEVEEYQIVFRRENPADPYSMDELVLKVAASSSDQLVLGPQIVGEVREAIRVTPRIEFVDRSAIFVPGNSMKAARVVDERNRG